MMFFRKKVKEKTKAKSDTVEYTNPFMDNKKITNPMKKDARHYTPAIKLKLKLNEVNVTK